MKRSSRPSCVILQGSCALTILEARALIKAALNGRFSMSPTEIRKVENACGKVAWGLEGAGDDREQLKKLFDESDR